MDEACWTAERKSMAWEQIARQKIRNQTALLERIGLTPPEKLVECVQLLKGQDDTNKEGEAASLYFRALFGTDFRRHSVDGTNAALNYGYTIVLSAMNRIIRSHGYATELGVHHCSRTNPFNLSCDLIEPFRPFVDEIVFTHDNDEDDDLPMTYKMDLIRVSDAPARYNGKRYLLSDAMEMWFLDFVKMMQEEASVIGDIQFG